MIDENRYGQFVIPIAILEKPEEALKILDGMVIYDARPDYGSHSIVFQAWSLKFSIIKLTDLTPRYFWHVGRKGEITWDTGSNSNRFTIDNKGKMKSETV